MKKRKRKRAKDPPRREGCVWRMKYSQSGAKGAVWCRDSLERDLSVLGLRGMLPLALSRDQRNRRYGNAAHRRPPRRLRQSITALLPHQWLGIASASSSSTAEAEGEGDRMRDITVPQGEGIFPAG